MKILRSALVTSLLGSAVLAIGLSLNVYAAEPVAAAGTAASGAVIPVADFFKNPQLNQASMSPDGKHVALLVVDSNGRLMLAVTKVDVIAPKVLARFSNVDVGNFNWVNNQRLVYSLADRKVAASEADAGPGLYAIDIDGNNQRQLVARHYAGADSGKRILSVRHSLYGVIAEKDTNDIYVAEVFEQGVSRRISFNLLRMNTVNGQTALINRPGDVTKWLVDKQGVPRIAVTYANNVDTTYLKDDATGKWRKLYETPNAIEGGGIDPELIGPDGSLYVTALQGKDTRSLYRYNLEKNQIEPEPIISLDGYDYNGTLIFNKSSNKILGAHYDTDAPGTLWLDENYKKIQKKVDDLFPGKVNRINLRSETDSDTVLVFSFSDVDPGTSLLYNHKTGKVTVLGAHRPWIKPEQMAYKDFVRYPARDGLSIPAYLTLPKGQTKNLPMVVLVHGGPNVRGEHWGWDPEVQFLASRGYAVLQPEFRGSMGYGARHEKLGWKQWGLTMQDDVTDGTKWAIAQGIADPKRICIAGASYGGYASLWGLVKEPEMYQCGISWVGVTDMSLLYTLTESDGDEDGEKFFLPLKVGDLQKDAVQLKATSVVENAAKLKRPLILAYGGADRRVPIAHGKRLMSALKGNDSKVEWIVYPEEGHGWAQLKNNIDFWTRAEKLLSETTGKK